MTSNLFRAALGCAAVVFAATTADATVTPSSSTPIILEHDPAGIVATAPTDGDGRVTFRNLAPGKYVLVIDGSALAASLNRLTTRKKESSGGVSFGIGGSLFGGGHSGSGHTGAGPVGGGHGSTRSGTGGNIGIGTTIPIGGSHDSHPMAPDIVVTVDLGPLGTFSSTSCYCQGAGARLSFTIPEPTGPAGMAVNAVDVVVTIADQASAGNLTSY